MNTTDPAPTGSGATTPVIVPTKLAHYVIRAKRFKEMIAWYRKVFHLRTVFEAPVIAFLTYDEEHHRIAFLNTAHLPEPDRMRTGIDHVAFTYADLPALLHTWKRLNDDGVTPFWCINHGPTTSMYYRDPDGNEIELQVDNYPTLEEASAYFASDAFAANPIGVDFDPEVLLQKLSSGVKVTALLAQGSAPVAAGKAYIYKTLPPPAQLDEAATVDIALARDACESLCRAYGPHADAGDADALANLYTSDGVFDRLGQLIVGHDAIRNVIADRPPGVWTRHACSNIRIEVGADGRSATGRVDLQMQRGREGVAEVEHIRAEYLDRFVLTEQGWRFSLRKVALVAEAIE